MRRTNSVICFLFLLVLSMVQFVSCRKEQDLKGLTALEQVVPTNFPEPVNRFENNPLSEEGFLLGKKLFYDGRLSIDNLHPCSSCHQADAAFGTYQHDRSHGVFNSHTLRNAPSLFNLAWKKSFHWDGAYAALEQEAVQPINGHIEMGESWPGVIKKLEADAEYVSLFRKVFRSPFIRPEFITKALSQFTGSIVSANAKYDRYKKGLATFTAAEERGYQLYKTNCARCHPEPLFTDDLLHNIGLPVDPLLNDFGRMMLTGDRDDSLKFKTPSLRNVDFSANYMHDGRFNTLLQVLNHYSNKVRSSRTLDPGLSGGIPLTSLQADDLVYFLQTLSDSALLKDPRFGRP